MQIGAQFDRKQKDITIVPDALVFKNCREGEFYMSKVQITNSDNLMTHIKINQEGASWARAILNTGGDQRGASLSIPPGL